MTAKIIELSMMTFSQLRENALFKSTKALHLAGSHEDGEKAHFYYKTGKNTAELATNRNISVHVESNRNVMLCKREKLDNHVQSV